MGNWACDLLLKYIICDNIVSYVLHVYTRVIYSVIYSFICVTCIYTCNIQTYD